MILRILIAGAIALALISSAEARHRHHSHHSHAYARVKCVGAYCAIVEETRDRPADCRGIAWCGCWLRHELGLADRSLNLAIRWASMGSAASPDTANVVVWRHHVAKLIEHRDGLLLIRSGNDRGAVRTRWISPRALGGVVAWRKV